jgi:hypothetical protein
VNEYQSSGLKKCLVIVNTSIAILNGHAAGGGFHGGKGFAEPGAGIELQIHYCSKRKLYFRLAG